MPLWNGRQRLPFICGIERTRQRAQSRSMGPGRGIQVASHSNQSNDIISSCCGQCGDSAAARVSDQDQRSGVIMLLQLVDGEIGGRDDFRREAVAGPVAVAAMAAVMASDILAWTSEIYCLPPRVLNGQLQSQGPCRRGVERRRARIHPRQTVAFYIDCQYALLDGLGRAVPNELANGWGSLRQVYTQLWF